MRREREEMKIVRALEGPHLIWRHAFLGLRKLFSFLLDNGNQKIIREERQRNESSHPSPSTLISKYKWLFLVDSFNAEPHADQTPLNTLFISHHHHLPSSLKKKSSTPFSLSLFFRHLSPIFFLSYPFPHLLLFSNLYHFTYSCH